MSFGRNIRSLFVRTLCGTAVLTSCALFVGSLSGQAARAGTGNYDWPQPKAMALRRVAPLQSSQHEPVTFSNLDCDTIEYRLVASSTMHTGCFTATAFGYLDSGSNTVIFNGTDEGLPLLPFGPHQLLVPWPKALDLLSLTPAPTDGFYISLYKNPLAVLQDDRNALGQLTDKQLTAGPDLPLTDTSGRPLIVNPQTLAFSSGGSWLVAETLSGSFVRINLATLEVTAFAPAFEAAGDPTLPQSQVAVSNDGRYVAINNESTDTFKVYDLGSCSYSLGSAPSEGSCRATNYRPFIRQQVSGLRSIGHLRFINDGLLSLEAVSANNDSNGTYELAPAASIDSLTDYIGLGDSYTSGEGAFDYINNTDSENNRCHLSRNSYPLLLTSDLFGTAGGHSVACSGAVINDIGSTSDSYRGQIKDAGPVGQLEQANSALYESITTNFLPGYLAQHSFVGMYLPRVLTVSVGGNDIGFGNMIQNCVEPHVSRHLSDDTCYDTYEDRLELKQLIDRTGNRWKALFRQLQAESPATTMYVIGYPEIADDTGNCALNVHMSKSELEFSDEVVIELNSAIQAAATAANVSYVDVSQALNGHRLCEANSASVAVNGLTAGKDGGLLGIHVFGSESYHPNALGQQLIEQAILRQTHNLTSGSTASTTTPNQDLLKKPASGRSINKLMPTKGMAAPTIRTKKPATVKVNGMTGGLKPKTTYQIRLDGAVGTVVGTTQSDDEGNIDTTITPPDGIPPGGHTIDITGPDETGDPVDVSQPVIMDDGSGDIDGDGIPDDTDSCALAPNSGHDDDHDGIDDVCDPVIGNDTGNTTDPGPDNILIPAQTMTNPQPASTDNTSPDIGQSNLVASEDSRPPYLFIASDVSGTLLSPVGGIQPYRLNLQTRVLRTGKDVTLAAAAHPRINLTGTEKGEVDRGAPTDWLALRRLPWQFWCCLPVIAWFILLLAYYAVRQMIRKFRPSPSK